MSEQKKQPLSTKPIKPLKPIKPTEPLKPIKPGKESWSLPVVDRHPKTPPVKPPKEEED